MKHSTAIFAIAAAGCFWIAAEAVAQVFAQAAPAAQPAAGAPGATPAPPTQPRNVSPVPVGAPPQASVVVGGQGGFGGAMRQPAPNFYYGFSGGPVPTPDDPELVKLIESENQLAHESDELIGQYAATENYQEREKLKTKLREVLSKQFDVQRQRRERELKSIEDRLSKLREQLKKRTDARETIIDRRIESLVSDAEGLGWTAPAAGNIPFGPGPARLRQAK
jgi:hypothetical protein